MENFPKDNNVVDVINNISITDENVWTIDEIILNPTTKLFLMLSLKTFAILGYIIYQNTLNDDSIIEFYQKVLDQYHNDSILGIHSDSDFIFKSEKIKKILDKEKIKISSTTDLKNKNNFFRRVCQPTSKKGSS